MNGSRLLIKFGGSLCDSQVLRPLAQTIRALAVTRQLTIVPGGGPFASAVREWDRDRHLGATASHWMAISAMDQMGRFLETQGFGIAIDEHALLATNVSPTIFLPYRFLRQTDALPHSWSVTSDSIAAHLALQFHIKHLVLLKSVDAPISPCPVNRAIEAGIVDPLFSTYLGSDTECWMVNGNHPEQLLHYERFGVPVIRELGI